MSVRGPDGRTHSPTCTEMATVPASREVQLPKVTIDNMTKKELKEFIPQLLKLVTGREDVWYSRRSAKPDWWPAGVNWATSKADWFTESYWTDNLRSVVRSCYRHLGKEDLLYDPHGIDIMIPACKQMARGDGPSKPQSYPSSPYKQGCNNTADKPQSYPPSPLKLPSRMYLPFSAEVFICFFCEAEFYSKDKMREHQILCQERPPDLRCASLLPSPRTRKDLPSKPYIPWEFVRLPLDKFIGYLDLLPVRQAAKLRRTRNSLEINCDDLGDLGPQSPLSPVTPRTPKSLISQLSREDPLVSSRKRLSYSLSMDKDIVSIESDPESSESDNDDESEDAAAAKQKDLNLLSIDLTSLLGQRVKNFIHVENSVQVVDNSEYYCKTPVKNSFLEKLRKKPPSYPVIYKPRRIANLHKQNHLYKFSRTEQKEFYEHLKTGLNKESRKRMKKMKKLRVRVTKLTKQKMMQYVPRKVLEKQLKCRLPSYVNESSRSLVTVNASYPQGPMLLSKNVDKILGLKKKSDSGTSGKIQSRLSVGNYISEEMEADLSKLKLTLYRSLLYEVEAYKAGSVIDPSLESQNVQKQTDKPEKVSPQRTFVPIAEREFASEFDKPKGGMSVLRALLRKNKEDSFLPYVNQPKSVVVTPQKTKSKAFDGLSKSLKADLKKDFRKMTAENPDVLSTPMSSPGSAVSSDESFTSPAVLKTANRTPVLDDSVSIISVSSDGESPHLNCCAGCNKKAEKREISIPVPVGKDMTKFLEPLSVNIESSGTKPDLKIDITYGVPSPVPSMTESPLPSTPIKKTVDPNDQISNVINEEYETTRRYTRSKGEVSIPTYEELSDILKQKKFKPKEKVTKSASESEMVKMSQSGQKNRVKKSSRERSVRTMEKSVNPDNQLIVKGISSPKSSPKTEYKQSLSDECNVKQTLHPTGKESLSFKPHAEKLELGMNFHRLEAVLKHALDGSYWTKKQEKGGVVPDIERGALKHELNGNYWATTKSRRKQVQQESSPDKNETNESCQVLKVIPVKKSVSLTPSPSPKKLENGDFRSITATQNYSQETHSKSSMKSEIDGLKRPTTDTPKNSPKKMGEKGEIEMSPNSDKKRISSKNTSSEKSVIHLRSSTLLTPTKMKIKTRSLSVDSKKRMDDNQYSLQSGNFIIDSPRRGYASPGRSLADNSEKNSPVFHSGRKESQSFLESGYGNNGSPHEHGAHHVSRKIDFNLRMDQKVESPSRPKRQLSSPLEAPRPSKLRKLSSDIGVKMQN